MMTSLINAEDRHVMEYLQRFETRFWVAGGTALSWYLGRSTNSDIDLFFRHADDYAQLREKIEKLHEKNINAYFRNALQPGGMTISQTHETENAITYTMLISSHDKSVVGYDVQLIKRQFYADVQSLLDDFDITVCQIATDLTDVWVGPNFASDVANRRLRLHRIARNSTKRFIKYWTYGYQPDDATLGLIAGAEDQNLKAGDDDY